MTYISDNVVSDKLTEDIQIKIGGVRREGQSFSSYIKEQQNAMELRDKAIAEGLAEGRAEGRAEGLEQGKAEGVLYTLISLVKDGILSITDAAKRAGMSVSEFEERSGIKA